MSDEMKQAVQDIINHVGPERLARNYNLTSMEIPGDMLRRLRQAVDAPRAVSASAGALLGDAIYALKQAQVGAGRGAGGRELALAATNAEQAEMWLKAAESARTSRTPPEAITADGGMPGAPKSSDA